MAGCRFTKRDGTPCMGAATGSNGGCWSHDDDYALERKRIARKGGQSGGRGRPQVELTRIKTQLGGLADGVLDGSVERSDAAVVSQVLNVYLRAVSVELKAREQLELVERLEMLEQALEDKNEGGRSWGA